MFRKTSKSLLAVVFVLTVVSAMGCGPSQDEAFMRAAMRSRSDNNDTPTPSPATAEANLAEGVSELESGSATSGQTGSRDPITDPGSGQQNAPAASGSDLNELGGRSNGGSMNRPVEAMSLSVNPIDERRPSQPLDLAARSSRSNENITEIGRAVRSYIDRTGFMPPHIMKAKAGGAVLSWRVAILPDLGFQDLYDAFDLEQPWDSDVNRNLLDRIPDCFVSPERFDSSTNYQAIVGEGFVFRKLRLDRGSISDGLENTLAFVEVDDRYAVPWTCPQDYEVTWETPTERVGNLRPDGFFALWASGTPTLIRSDVDRIKLLNALTPDAGDGQHANAIHQSFFSPAPVSNTASAETASSVMPATIVANKPTDRSPSGPTADHALSASLPNLPLLPVPKDELVRAAIERVQSLYSDRFRDVSQVTERTAIAGEMLDTALRMREDPAGAYAMQEAVLSYATATGDLSLVTRALDNRAQMFDIDAIAENARALVEFTKANGGPVAVRIDHVQLVRRCVPVIAESIRRDEYELPIELVRHLVAMERVLKRRRGETGISLLRTRLNVAKDYLDQATDAIAILRSDESDPSANGAVGRYTAFIKGDWKPGLEMLSRGDNERLVAIANEDLNTTSDPQRMLAVADSWYDLGNSTANKVFRGGCYERAAHWYSTAYDLLPESLAKLHAKTRLAESTDAAIGSPLAIVARIAKDAGFEIEPEIERIKYGLNQLAIGQ